ncbi:MAG TPA: metallophosphoesterase, partial [Tepidisphaeraceae bacterium]|nr:metallophosphoesterase [Tepidisphaeraceae bacterium]
MMLNPMTRWIGAGVILLGALTTFGQEPPAVDETPLPNVGHTRHHHPRTPKMPGTPDPARFTTSRPDALQLPLPEEKDAFTFVIFGDRTGGPAEGVRVLADAVRDVNLLAPDLVMTVGDLIQGYNAQEPWIEQMREYRTIMDKLVCPWFPVAGNHDVYWRGPADQKPDGEHEQNYELHFGPLWYAFKHKRCVFIALYSDEGNPETGEKTFHKPESQRMSPEQFEWLKKTLADNKDAEHIFLFLHHPRWLGSNTDGHGGYGDDWNKVHDELKAAGNVTAVFAGHIHHMRYDPKDGIEYVTLATTGGGQSGLVPHVGFLHHYHVVTVRKGQVAMAAFPVGQVMDVREITGELVRHVTNLANSRLPMTGDLKLRSDGSVDGTFRIALTNPTDRDVDFTVALDSKDSRWRFWPDHEHGVVKAGETREFELGLRRPAGGFDESFRP